MYLQTLIINFTRNRRKTDIFSTNVNIDFVSFHNIFSLNNDRDRKMYKTGMCSQNIEAFAVRLKVCTCTLVPSHLKFT